MARDEETGAEPRRKRESEVWVLARSLSVDLHTSDMAKLEK